MIENQFDHKIKILWSDNGGEFHMKDFFILKESFTKPVVSKHPKKIGL